MKKFISLLIINKVYDRLPEISILKCLFTSSIRCRVFLWRLQQLLLSTVVPRERYATDCP